MLDSTLEGAGGKKIYLDGVLQTLDGANNGNTTGVTSSAFTSAQNLYVGGYNNNGVAGFFFAGLLDDAMLFNVAKTAAEVRSIYEQTRWRFST